MRSVGVRERKARASEIVRRVQEPGEGVDITLRGRAVARLVPVGDGARTRPRGRAVWASIDRLAAEVGARWPRGRSARAAVREQRRAL